LEERLDHLGHTLTGFGSERAGAAGGGGGGAGVQHRGRGRGPAAVFGHVGYQAV